MRGVDEDLGKELLIPLMGPVLTRRSTFCRRIIEVSAEEGFDLCLPWIEIDAICLPSWEGRGQCLRGGNILVEKVIKILLVRHALVVHGRRKGVARNHRCFRTERHRTELPEPSHWVKEAVDANKGTRRRARGRPGPWRGRVWAGRGFSRR